jgi:hypothetical protein
MPSAAREFRGGFNLNQDIAAPPGRRPTNGRFLPGIVARRNHPVVDNPVRRGQRPWTWNHGIAWYAAPTYWGGGFWGPYALDEPSYVPITPDSPGATLLENYQLTQTPCGQPDLVVLYGPDDSVICTFPNDIVAPGYYDVDWSNLMLVSREESAP